MPTLEALLDKELILDCLNDLFVGTDDRDFARVRRALADSVLFDMTSLAGGDPMTLTRDAVASMWEKGLSPIEQVQHQTGNHSVRVDGDRATAFCYGIALHYRKTASGRNTRTFVGSYDFGLARDGARWRIDSFRFNLKFLDGNLELEKEQS